MMRWLILLVCLPAALSAQTKFTDVTEAAHINHQFRVYEGMFGGGACVFDFNRDGFEDVYLTGGMNSDQLLRNNGNGTFSDVFSGSGFEVTRDFVTQGAVSADVNRDGHVDIFITTLKERDSTQVIPRAPNLLFLNRGDGTFRDATEEFGLANMYSFSTGANFGDFNGDGWPDLYVGNYFIEYEGKLSSISDATIVGANQTARGYLLQNQSGAGFENVYEHYGLGHRGFGFGGVFTDYDNDGDQDLFVNHDFGYKATPDFMLRNDYPNDKFTDVSKALDLDLRINSMGAAVGDYNGDGLMDYYMTNIRFNHFMVNQGSGKPFVNAAKGLGLNYVSISWGANFADFDHDGDLDLFVANGDLNPNCTPLGNYYFEQKDGKFSEQAAVTGLQDYGIGRGSVIFDFDNDGDQDIIVVNQIPTLPNYPTETITRLFRNDARPGNWLSVELVGKWSETRGLGSRVEAYVGNRLMIREIDGGGASHLSQSSSRAHFGLGDANKVDSLVVIWAGGLTQIIRDVPGNQFLVVEEAERPERPGSSKIYWLLCLGAVGPLSYIGYLRWSE